MKSVQIEKIKAGDRVKFKALCRWATRKEIRKVTAVELWGRKVICVRFNGWPDFQLRHNEILEHISFTI